MYNDILMLFKHDDVVNIKSLSSSDLLKSNLITHAVAVLHLPHIFVYIQIYVVKSKAVFSVLHMMANSKLLGFFYVVRQNKACEDLTLVCEKF